MRIWLVVAVCVMTLAVLLSASRSGLIGLMTAFVLSTALTRGRGTLAMRRWVIFQFTLLALVALSFANHDVLLRRLEESMTRAQENRGRLAIWRDTIRLADDFPVTGTGAGTFGKAISVYQTAEPGYAIDQAHNHYLQVMAEGGASLLLPGAIAAGLFLLLASRSLKQDLSSNYLIRAGACAGIAGVLVQCMWETGLTMPANALLFAMLAAIATSSYALPAQAREPREGRLNMLRIGFDLDGVVADFRTAFLDVAASCWGRTPFAVLRRRCRISMRSRLPTQNGLARHYGNTKLVAGARAV